MFNPRPEELLSAKRNGKPIMLVIDECAHDATDSCTHLHNILQPTYVLGMSATPFRTDRAKLMFSKQVKDAGIHQLIQDGYLSRYHHFTIPDWNPSTVAEFYAAEPQRWGKSIFYFLTTDECFETQRQLTKRGIVSDVVTGATTTNYREGQLDAFRTGQMPCLINCMVLTEGFDDPSLATAWVRDSGKGPTMQMAGRAFRKCANVPFKMVVQSKQTRWPMIKTAMPEEQYLWENEWRTLRINPELEKINNNARFAIAMTDVSLPPWLVERTQKRRRRIRRQR